MTAIPSKLAIGIRNLTLLVGCTMTVMAGATIAPSQPQMQEAFADAPHAALLVRLILTAPALTIIFTAPFCGFLLDRWGRRPVLLTSLIVYGCAGSAGYFLNSLNAILLSRMILGIGVAGIMSGFTTVIADHYSGVMRHRFMGWQASFMGYGGVLFLVTGGLLAEVGWRYPFLIYLFAFIVLPCVIIFISETRGKAQRAASSQKVTARLPIARLLVVYLTAFIGMLLFYIAVVQLPFHIKDIIEGANNSQVGMTMAWHSLVAATIATQYRKVKKLLSYPNIFCLIFLFMGTGFSIVSQAGGWQLLLSGLFISGIGLGFFFANINAWLVHIAPPELRGRAIGGMATFIYLGQFLSPIATQPIESRFDPAGVFVAGGATMLLLAGCFAIAGMRRLRTER